MMEEMLDWVRDYSTLSRVELEVVAINKKARHLYEKCGFVEEGLIKNGVKIGDGYEDIVLMAKMIER
jgi:acetyltransferase, GNAT family